MRYLKPGESLTRSQKFIQNNKKILICGKDYFNPDTTLQSRDEYFSSDLKILMVFPTPSEVKSVSATKEALLSYILEICNVSRTEDQNKVPYVPHYDESYSKGNSREGLNIFVDFCYMPNASDLKVFDKNFMPYAIGNITHLDASYFDVIGFSISVLAEVIAAPVIIKSFSRCDSPIPMTWSERKDLSVLDTPVMFAGGITAACGDVMFGDIGDGRKAFLDYLYLGSCEKLDITFERIIKAKQHNLKLISNISSVYQEGKGVYENTISVQDYINSLFDLHMIYQPQSYEVVYDKRNRIISNKKINVYAQDFVTPYYPLNISEEYLGVARGIINANGDAAGKAQSQISDGCSASGHCSFKVTGDTRIWTDRGVLKIKDLSGKSNIKVQAINVENSKRIESQGSSRVFNVRLESGHSLESDINHIYMVFDGTSVLKEKKTYELLHGDIIFRKIGSDFNYEYQKDSYGHVMSEELAELLGFLHGDGCFDVRSGKIRCQIFTREGENRYLDLFRRILKTDNKLQNKYESKLTPGVVVNCLQKSVDFSEIYDDNLYLVPCTDLRVPEVIFKSPKSVMRSYIRGLFQSDGWSNKESIGLTSVSRDFIEDVSLLISFLGYDSSIIFNGYWDRNSDGSHKPSYQLCLRKWFHNLYREEIGFETKLMDYVDVDNYSIVTLPKTIELTNFIRSIYKNREACRADGFGTLYDYPNDSHPFVSVNTLRSFKLKHSDIKLPHFYDLVSECKLVPDRVDSIVDTLREVEMYDVVETESHLCVYGEFLTHQCAEGCYTSGWTEKSMERKLYEAREAKKYSAAYKFSPYSFNTNYAEDYKGYLYNLMQIYPKVSFINQRMEELGKDTDALKMMKLVGASRLSCPLEGLSPRIMNNLLNKCLSEESIDNVMSFAVHGKFTELKIGGIFTGFEEDEDIQWICDFADRYKEKSIQEGGKVSWRLKFTPLVHYPGTACEYYPRKSTEKSFNGEHWLSDEWYDKFKEHNIFFKVNGFRYSTFIEQSIVDLGRSLTPLMYKEILCKDIPVYSLRSIATDEFVQGLKNIVNKDWFFKERHPEHYISPIHRIHLALMGSYIPRALRVVEAYQKGNIFNSEPDVRCLKTYEGAKTKCMASCMSNNPLKIYNDVELDKDDNMIGDYRELKGCERCPTKDYKLGRLNRKILSTKDSNDILACPRKKPALKVRFMLYRNPEYSVLNPNNTAHTFMSKFLVKSEALTDMFYMVEQHTNFWQSDPDQPYEFSGVQIVDVLFTDKEALNIINSLLDEVNSELKSVRIMSLKEEFLQDKIGVTDYNVFRFETSLPQELFDSSCTSYNGEIKVKSNDVLTTIVDKSLRKPVYVSKGTVIGYFVLPCKHNPSQYMMGLLKDKKISSNRIRTDFEFTNIMTVREASGMCKCGKERNLLSISTGKKLPFGLEHITNALLRVELSK